MIAQKETVVPRFRPCGLHARTKWFDPVCYRTRKSRTCAHCEQCQRVTCTVFGAAENMQVFLFCRCHTCKHGGKTVLVPYSLYNRQRCDPQKNVKCDRCKYYLSEKDKHTNMWHGHYFVCHCCREVYCASCAEAVLTRPEDRLGYLKSICREQKNR